MNNCKNQKNYSEKGILKRIDDLERRAVVITLGTTFIGMGITLLGVGVTNILSNLRFPIVEDSYTIIGLGIILFGVFFFLLRDRLAKIIKI